MAGVAPAAAGSRVLTVDGVVARGSSAEDEAAAAADSVGGGEESAGAVGAGSCDEHDTASARIPVPINPRRQRLTGHRTDGHPAKGGPAHQAGMGWGEGSGDR